jgi:hypothetical protein
VQSGIQPHDSSGYMNGNCVNCVLMYNKNQEASIEFKSLRLIATILHEEIKILRSQQEDIKVLKTDTFSMCKKKKVSVVQYTSDVSAQETCDFK